MKKFMKEFFYRAIRSFAYRAIGYGNMQRGIKNLAKFLNIDLITPGYQNVGICLPIDDCGEEFLIQQVLPKLIISECPVLIDVGANIGQYSLALRESFPTANIYSFEPNPAAFEVLIHATRDKNIACQKLGLSSMTGHQKMYNYLEQEASGHGSIYQEVFSDLHRSTAVKEIEFQSTTLDDFCTAQNISEIHFIKIDTEGHEFDVLIGAQKLLNQGKIHIIQFEFNEMNIVSRHFLRDFYSILQEYRIYRLYLNSLLPLGTYSSWQEIFLYQNLVAIHKSIERKI